MYNILCTINFKNIHKFKSIGECTMKPNELYQKTPETISKCLGHLKGFYYDHIHELSDSRNVDSYWGLENKNEKVEIKYYVDHCFDGRRTWTLASVWFEEKPIMVIQNAGREGDDHRVRFITDAENYKRMLHYISTLLEEDDVTLESVDPDEDIPTLDTFYGYSMNTVGKSFW